MAKVKVASRFCVVSWTGAACIGGAALASAATLLQKTAAHAVGLENSEKDGQAMTSTSKYKEA